MSTEPLLLADAAAEKSVRRGKQRCTSRSGVLPPTLQLRAELRRQIQQVAQELDNSTPPARHKLEQIAKRLLSEQQQPESYLGWTTVMLSSEFWRDQVAATSPERRLFLLPRRLEHAAECNRQQPDSTNCGACRLPDLRSQAERLGYQVLATEQSLKVIKLIVGGAVDAIVGVASLSVLEKAIDKASSAGIPCIAAPLASGDCAGPWVDESWLREILSLRQPTATPQTNSYLQLLRTARGLFENDELVRLSPRLRGGPTLAELNGQGVAGLDAVAGTEAIAYDFLARGGKYARPFITLAVYDALAGGVSAGGGASGAEDSRLETPRALATIPDAVRRVAMSIETFHKASLVHDDIEDDDDHRYGEPTLHRRYGIATAINVGDYLIGLGYRLVSRQAAELGGETCADLLDRLADAHLRLSEGQGAELLWRDSRDKQLTPRDALEIYALKTAPAFEAALLCGVRCAGSVAAYEQPLKQLAEYLGVAFQVINDLKDWQGDDDNKLAAGLDALAGRPTLLWAFALDGLAGEARRELLELAASEQPARVARIHELYQQADVFEKARRLVDDYQSRAAQLADKIDPASFRQLLYYLIDTILERPAEVKDSLAARNCVASSTQRR